MSTAWHEICTFHSYLGTMTKNQSSMSRSSTILVTGGAGYIGSHVARRALSSGRDVVILDNLSTGARSNLPAGAQLVEGDISDKELVSRVIRENAIQSVIHLAGSLVASESVTDPIAYYSNNTVGTLALAGACLETGVANLVYSSSAAVYGQTGAAPVDEDHPLEPANPYGASKLFAERLLFDIAKASTLRVAALRYFNVAGVDPRQISGPMNPGSKSLFNAVCATILGQQPALDIFGDDCATPDGSCVRDYIHVNDLAATHELALGWLETGGASRAFNCGYGRGVSVLDVVRAAEQVTGKSIPVSLLPRRWFDPETVVADPNRLKTQLNWQPEFDNLSEMIASTLEWERRKLALSRS